MTGRARLVYVPGYGGSALPHWQRRWAASDPDAVVVEQDDWRRPDAAAWVARLDATLLEASGPVVLVAHSLGCLAVARWSLGPSAPGPVRAALLVAPTDAEATGYAIPASGFVPIPLRPLPFPSVVVVGQDDPVVSPERAEAFASRWGSRFVRAHARGHVDAQSGHGPWPEGERLLSTLVADSAPRRAEPDSR